MAPLQSAARSFTLRGIRLSGGINTMRYAMKPIPITERIKANVVFMTKIPMSLYRPISVLW